MIFVTGASGLIGSALVSKLIQEKYPVVALRRKNSDVSFISDPENKIEWVEGDLNDLVLLDKLCSQADFIIHCAALIGFSKKSVDQMYQTNVEGTKNLINACIGKNIKKFVHISSIAALGRIKGESLVTEEAVWEESDNNTHYAISKNLAETEVWRGIEEGIPAVIFNPSVIIGPHNWHQSSTKLFRFIYKGNPFYTRGDINYIDVRDIVDLILLTLNNDIVNERYILNAGKISYKDFFSKIADRFQVKPPSVEVKPWMAAIAWRWEGIKTFFTGGEPLITKDTIRLAEFSYTYPADKVCKDFNFQFRKLDDTLKHTCDALLHHNAGKK